MVGTRASRHHDAPPPLAEQLTGHLATTGHPPHQHRHPPRHRPPSPRVLVPLTPAGLVEVGHCLLGPRRAGCRRWRGLRPVADRPHEHRHAAHRRHRLLRRALRPAIRPRAPRDRRLPAGPIRSAGDTCRPGRPRGLPTRWARQLMPWLRGHDRCARRSLDHLRPPWCGLVAREGGLAARARHGLDDYHLRSGFAPPSGLQITLAESGTRSRDSRVPVRRSRPQLSRLAQQPGAWCTPVLVSARCCSSSANSRVRVAA